MGPRDGGQCERTVALRQSGLPGDETARQGQDHQYFVDLGSASLVALGAIMRPLLFATLQPELAEAKGVSLRRVSVLFLAIAALAVAACTQIVGVLLVFTLMVGPAAAAQNLSTRLSTGVGLAALFALAQAWLGVTFAFYTDWPTSFWITALSALVYGASLLRRR